MQRARVMTVIALAVLIAAATNSPSAADDWPQFLGKYRTGVSSEKGLLNAFESDGPKIVWRTPLGVGMSSVVISDGRAYTLFQDEEQQYLVALNAADGNEVWRSPIAPVYENAMGNGPRATPTVMGDQVFAFSGEGILSAFQAKDGKGLWTVNVTESLDGTPSEYGMSCSPMVADNYVIIHAGTDSAAVAAYDRVTGKPVWKAGQGKAGYSSPVLMTIAEKNQVISLTAAGVFSIDPATGSVFWDFPFQTEYNCNTACPVQIDSNTVLISAGENHGSVLLKITSSGKELKASEIWSSTGKDSQLRAEWQTPVIHDGHLYGLDNNGSAGPITNLVCIRLKDQKTMWQKARFGKSNLILADDKLFMTTMNGEVIIVEASPAGFQELGRATIMETTRQAPTLANGHLFVRDDREVLCIDVRRTP